jgi:hypothetical protein
MKHDIFEFCAQDMTTGDRFFRVVFLLALLAVVALDIFVWRP